MKKTAALVGLIFFALLAGKRSDKVHAAAASSARQFQETRQEGKGCSAPKSWGEVKGVADRAIAFEDSAGTIRVLDTGPCMRGETQLIVEITRS